MTYHFLVNRYTVVEDQSLWRSIYYKDAVYLSLLFRTLWGLLILLSLNLASRMWNVLSGTLLDLHSSHTWSAFCKVFCHHSITAFLCWSTFSRNIDELSFLIVLFHMICLCNSMSVLYQPLELGSDKDCLCLLIGKLCSLIHNIWGDKLKQYIYWCLNLLRIPTYEIIPIGLLVQLKGFST